MDFNSASTLLGLLDRELWVVTACAGERRGGLIATFVSQSSIVPTLPRMLLGLSRVHHTYELVEGSRAFALHLIGEEHLPWVWHFGLQSGRDEDKLAGFAQRPGITGAPLLTDALGWLECRVVNQLNTGDRSLYLAEVVDAHHVRSAPLLTLKRLDQLAPQDKLQRLHELMAQDRLKDEAAIRAYEQLVDRT